MSKGGRCLEEPGDLAGLVGEECRKEKDWTEMREWNLEGRPVQGGDRGEVQGLERGDREQVMQARGGQAQGGTAGA